MGADYYRELSATLYRGRRCILTADTAGGAVRAARRIREAGADAVLVIAGVMGSGEPPPDADVFVIGVTGMTLMDSIRAYATAISAPSRDMCAAIDSFDPDHEALVVSSYFIPSAEVCGRPVLAPERSEWRGLEDKLSVDALWDEAGVTRASSAIVDSTDETAMSDAVHRLDRGDGVVLVADNTEGWHGGGEYTRYLSGAADPSATYRFFAEHSHRVRVMPFLVGIPCSIHGLVTPDRVLAFRPVEMLVYRRAGSDEFVYAGVDTVWDPPEATREQMRQAAVSVGEVLRERVGYRGAFGIDGVSTDAGFLPTELNPRLTTGLRILAKAAGNYPIDDINRAVIAGLDVDLRPESLEREIVTGADSTRTGLWSRPVTDLTVTETTELPVAYDGSSWVSCDPHTATATMSLGPAAQGARVLVELTEHHELAPGGSLADIAARSFALADAWWNTRIGALISGVAVTG